MVTPPNMSVVTLMPATPFTLVMTGVYVMLPSDNPATAIGLVFVVPFSKGLEVSITLPPLFCTASRLFVDSTVRTIAAPYVKGT